MRRVFQRVPNEKKITFKNLFGSNDKDYTIIIPFTLSGAEYKILENTPAMVPGINLAALGNNWQIYLNGKLIREQMDVKPDGSIKRQYSWRKITFSNITRTY